jgi:hypothetical protein
MKKLKIPEMPNNIPESHPSTREAVNTLLVLRMNEHDPEKRNLLNCAIEEIEHLFFVLYPELL